MDNLNKNIIPLSKKEIYIASGSTNELGGPYHSNFSACLGDIYGKEYENIFNKFYKNNGIDILDIPLVLETLYLLIHEMSDWDLGALYIDITKDDVKKLFEKIKNLYDGKSFIFAEKGIYLWDKIKIDEWAFNKEAALKFLQLMENLRKPCMGIYIVVSDGNGLYYSNSNFIVDRREEEGNEPYYKRTVLEALNYIDNYPENASLKYYYTVV